MRRGQAVALVAVISAVVAVCLLLCLRLFLHASPAPALAVATPDYRRAKTVPRVETVDCWFAVPARRAARCGRLVAPESWGAADGRDVVVPFVVFLAQSNNSSPGAAPQAPLPDPVIYINGGPGEPSQIDAESIDHWWGLLAGAGWARGRDVVVFDERGVGLSHPNLSCPEMIDIGDHLFTGALGPKETRAAWAAAAARCHARLTGAGIRLDRYNTDAIVRDLAALVDGLGYRSWNLLAVSYGTRVALSFLRDHGAGTRSVVLDSVYPPEVRAYEGAAANAAHAMAGLIEHCAANASCNAANPHLAKSLQSVLRRAAAEGIVVPLHRPGAPVRLVTLDQAKLVEVLFYGFYRSDDLRLLPDAITALEHGKPGSLEPFVQAALENYKSAAISHGLYLSVTCHDEYPFNDPQVTERSAAASGDFREFALADLALAACPSWPVGVAGAGERLPVHSDVPVLMLSGDLDPVTPTLWSKQAITGLPRGTLFHFPGVGHGVLASTTCAQRLVERFFAQPGPQPFDDCLLGLSAAN
jgi:pimeloyl-ACP methyl ester carboxylesterase